MHRSLFFFSSCHLSHLRMEQGLHTAWGTRSQCLFLCSPSFHHTNLNFSLFSGIDSPLRSTPPPPAPLCMPCSFIQPLGEVKTFIGDLLCVQGRKVGPEEKQHATFVFMELGVLSVRMGREALNKIISELHSVPRGP